MAEIAVSFLLDQLTPFLVEGAQLLGGLQDEVEHIRDELQSMRAFLKAVDEMDEPGTLLQEWVKQVREVAYDTEDILDLFILHLSPHHGRTGFYAFLRKISRSIKNLKSRHRIVSEIRRLSSRVDKIAERRRRYHGPISISEHGSSSGSNMGSRVCDDRRSDALLLEEAELVGIEEPKKQLLKWLLDDDPRLRVVSVVGMGGLGKTTLVKKVYDDLDLETRFQNHAWITISQSFEMRELLKDLIQQLFVEIRQPIPEGMETMDNVKLKALIKDLLQGKRYVIVLDDVWSTDAWNAFKYALPNSNCGSRVLLTTRILDVASTSSKEFHGNLYAMKSLSLQESWALFCRKTFQANHCPKHLESISLGILEKCDGLPLAIVTMGGFLATKDENRIHEWEMVHRSLGAGRLDGNITVDSMKKILSLSYNDLSCYLKVCFLYLSIFPEDYLIERMRLIRLWSAEGFVEERDGNTVEEVAEGYLIELVNRSLVQVVKKDDDGIVKICRIHDLLREIVLSKSKEYNIVSVASEGGTSSWPEKVRRFSIHYSLGNVQVQQPNKHFSRLRSLLMFEVAEPLPRALISELLTSRGGVRLLKVLDLRGASLETIPDEVFKLFHLRYLSLRNTKIKTIPNSIGQLQKLETLDLKQTNVTDLPVQILKLQRLRHLLVYSYNVQGYLTFHAIMCIKAPRGIQNLSYLQKLCCIDASQSCSGRVIEEFGKLTQLRKLGVVKLRREDGEALCSSIEKMSNLRSLIIGSLEEGEILAIGSLSRPPPFLQRLGLLGHLEKLPEWIQHLHNLVNVYLRWSKLREDPVQSLQHLPNLVALELHQAYDGEGLCFRRGGFEKLKTLWISTLQGLRWVGVEEGSLARLQALYIQNCNLVEELPSGIEHLSRLKVLELDDMSHELISALDPDTGRDYWKVSHIPNVWIGSVRDGPWSGYLLQR